jgi:hypothetical protein
LKILQIFANFTHFCYFNKISACSVAVHPGIADISGAVGVPTLTVNPTVGQVQVTAAVGVPAFAVHLVVAYVPLAVAYAGEHAYTEISSDADILPGVPVIVGIPNVAGVHDVPVVSAIVAVYPPFPCS